MHPASRRQISAMLDTFGQTSEVAAFDLGCLDHERGRMSFRNAWTAAQVRKALGWLAARNATGSSCYIRPARTIAERRWVLVDGLTLAALVQLTAAQRPSMIVQTVDCFQAWMRLDEPVDAATGIEVARSLTRRVGGDPGTIDPAQIGRLPGTTDRSRVRDGPAPFVVLRFASRTAAIPVPRDVKRPDGQCKGRREDDESKRGQEDIATPGDRDFAITCRLLEDGADDHTIAAVIAAVRGFDAKCQGGYVPRLISAARRHIQTRRQ